LNAAAQEDPRTIWQWAENLRSTTPAFRIELRTEGNKDVYMMDDSIVFTVKVDQACYLTILDLGTSGNIIQLFPNQWHSSNKVEANKEYRIPPTGSQYSYKVVGPASDTELEVVKAIATAKPLSDQAPAETTQKGGFKTLKYPSKALSLMKKDLSSIDQWGTADLRFKIREKGAQ